MVLVAASQIQEDDIGDFSCASEESTQTRSQTLSKEVLLGVQGHALPTLKIKFQTLLFYNIIYMYCLCEL